MLSCLQVLETLRLKIITWLHTSRLSLSLFLVINTLCVCVCVASVSLTETADGLLREKKAKAVKGGWTAVEEMG